MGFVRLMPRGSKSPRMFSLYVFFKDKNGKWTEPQYLGEILNSPGNQSGITPDAKYIFYVSGDGSYWVDAKIIQQLNQK